MLSTLPSWAICVNQPMGIGRRQIALGPFLEHHVVGDGFDEKVGPIGVLHGARIVELEHQIRFRRRDDPVFVEDLTQ